VTGSIQRWPVEISQSPVIFVKKLAQPDKLLLE